MDTSSLQESLAAPGEAPILLNTGAKQEAETSFPCTALGWQRSLPWQQAEQ